MTPQELYSMLTSLLIDIQELQQQVYALWKSIDLSKESYEQEDDNENP